MNEEEYCNISSVHKHCKHPLTTCDGDCLYCCQCDTPYATT